MGNSLAGQRVMVVGGNSGMGLAVSARLMKRRCQVLIVGRSRDKLDAAREQLRASGNNAHPPLRAPGNVAIEQPPTPGSAAQAPSSTTGDAASRQWTAFNAPILLQADVTDEAQVQQLFEASGPVDHVICTAADIRGAYELLPQLALDALDRAIRSKVIAPILLAKHGAPRMPALGSITLTSGIAAYRPRPKGVAVAAINAALEGVVRAMAVELAPLRINAVSPGWVRTPIWNDVAGTDSESLLAAMAERLPVGRVGTGDDIADAIVFLLGNGYTTGTVLHVDGGHRLV